MLLRIPCPLLRPQLGLLPPYLRRESATLFRPRAEQPGKSMAQLERNVEPQELTLDFMTESCGLAYATRSEEEGFGGIYARHQTISTKHGDDAVDMPSTEGGKAGESKPKTIEVEERKKKED